MKVFICGVRKGETKEYACPSCGYESDDIENFAVSMCWDCMYPKHKWQPYTGSLPGRTHICSTCATVTSDPGGDNGECVQ